MKNLIVLSLIVFSTVACKAQSTYYGSDSYNDGYASNAYPDDLSDWHLEARVRISNGIASGLITNRESNRLYDELERIERKEYFYQEDGNFSGWEQDEIWADVINFNRNLGYELTDSDRVRFGYDVRGFNRVGYGPWFYVGGFNFYRFDSWGYGSRRNGYLIPRNAYSYRYDFRGRPNHYSNFNRNNRNYNNGNYRNNNYRNNTPRGNDRSSSTYNRGNNSDYRGNNSDYRGNNSDNRGNNSGSVGSRQNNGNDNRTSSARRPENANSGGSATRSNSRQFDSRTSSERGSMSGTRPSSRSNSNTESRNERRSDSVAPSRSSRTENGSTQRSSDSGQRNSRRN